MLSRDVRWIDIDAEQWSNLWDLLYGPARRPARLYGVLDGGVPVALVHTRAGLLELETWPDGASSTKAAAAVLRRETGVEQVILVERGELAALWERQQQGYRRDLDYDRYAMHLGALTTEFLNEQAVCDPPLSALTDYPPIRYDALLDLLHRALGNDGHFVLAAFASDTIWYSLAGTVTGGVLVTLTSSLGLLPPGTTWPGGEWRTSYRLLLRACTESLGPPTLGVFLDVPTFKRLPFAADPVALLRTAAAGYVAILDPWPAAI